MSECDKTSCSGCEKTCDQRKMSKEEFLAPPNPHSNIKKVIGIVSGKGGVGKSLVTAMLAVLLNKKGYSTAILDADVTGPSIPRAFGLKKKAKGSKNGILPVKSKEGISIMSVNLLLPNDTDPVVWRGPIIAGTVKQFWSDVVWDDIDVMLVDMPPGTGDVPLTVFQSLPLNGIVIVSSPQSLVSMIVSKAAKMAEKMEVPILGLVENMSYAKCPDCGKEIKIFGESHIDEIAKWHGLKVLAKMPIDPVAAEACDSGSIEFYDSTILEDVASLIEKL